ncbi:TadE/TadG family type IV pilus assembly protein [Alkalilacustris brevis]|uniref:TadE/TadG family type IV pilus assembly protein n=1 Tax=Alkalilacustris brevis TaxID=2026338 RepID=UPI0013901691|nr:TadE/TadG family type IV pilus assembly protein [Alkalilacustris brevis]
MFRRYRRCTSGATAIEFALVAPVAIVLCLSILEVGRAVYLRNELAYAVDLGARKVLLDPAVAEQDVLDTVRAGLTGANRGQADIETQVIADGLREYRLVAASIPFAFIVPFVQKGAFSLSVHRRIPLG